MSFSHNKLDVYKVSLDYIKWVNSLVDRLTGKHRFARDQLLRASQSIPLNIAEGNGKYSEADRNRFFAIARGSALECAAIQDVLIISEAVTKEEHLNGEMLLVRIVSMLTKMTKSSWIVKEDNADYISDDSLELDSENHE